MMILNRYLKTFYLVLILIIPFLESKGQTEDKKLLTVEETLNFIKMVYVDQVPEEAIAMSKRTNPAARPYLYKILSDSTQKHLWPQVIGSFAYLGQKDDIEKIEKFLLERKGVLQNYEYSSAMMVFDALGAMSARGLIQAKTKLKEMMNPVYWDKMKFRVYETTHPDLPDFKSHMIVGALSGYAYSKSSDFNEVADSVLKTIKDPRQQQLIKREVEETREINRLMKDKKY